MGSEVRSVVLVHHAATLVLLPYRCVIALTKRVAQDMHVNLIRQVPRIAADASGTGGCGLGLV